MNITHFSNEATNFIQNHKLLCLTALGLIIAGCVGKLRSKIVVLIKTCLGITKKTDEVGREHFTQTTNSVQQPLPIQTKSLNEDELWQLLTEKTKKNSVKYHPRDVRTHRFPDILCPIETSVTKNERFIHANYVAENPYSKKFVASQAPMTTDFDFFWELIFENNYTIIDLTTPKDKINPYYPQQLQKSTSYGVLSITLTKIETYMREYNITNTTTNESKLIKRYHFNTWMDFSSVSVPTLASLVKNVLTSFKGNLWIHCRAGVGRTGTLITAFILKEKIEKKEISLENLDEALTDLIVTLRQQRGESFVQQSVQLHLLQQYGKSLLTST